LQVLVNFGVAFKFEYKNKKNNSKVF
jgi:hypothetical protein